MPKTIAPEDFAAMDDAYAASLMRARALDARDSLGIEADHVLVRIDFDEVDRIFSHGRRTLIKQIAGRSVLLSDLCASLARDASAVRKDIEILASHGIVRIEKISNPGHGVRLRISAPARLVFQTRIFEETETASF